MHLRSMKAVSALMLASQIPVLASDRVTIQFLGLPQCTHETSLTLGRLTGDIGGKVEVTLLPGLFTALGRYFGVYPYLDAVKNVEGLDLRVTSGIFLHNAGNNLQWNVFKGGVDANTQETALLNAGFLRELDAFAVFIRNAERIRVTGKANFRYGYIPVLEQYAVAGVDLGKAYPYLVAAINRYLAKQHVSASVRTSPDPSNPNLRVSGLPLEAHAPDPPADLGTLDYWSNDGAVNYDRAGNTSMKHNGAAFANSLAAAWRAGRQVVPAYWHYEMNGTYTVARKKAEPAKRGTLDPFTHSPGLYQEIKDALCGSRAAMGSACAHP